MASHFTPAKPEDIPVVRALIQQRIDWMDAVGIRQWNISNYWEAYPVEYFQEKVRLGQLMILRRQGEERLIGAAVLADSDPFWDDDPTPAYYIHNLATALDIKGAGAEIIALCEALALERGINRMRLDCNRTNEFLNRYYEERGYLPVGPVDRGAYHGLKREKLLK